MSKEPTNIDRLLREKLDGFEMTPPPSVWDNTSAALGARRKRRFFLWFFLGFFLVAGAGTGIYLMNDEQLESTEHAQQTSKLEVHDSTVILKKLGRDGSDIDLLNDEARVKSKSTVEIPSSGKQDKQTEKSFDASDTGTLSFNDKDNEFSSVHADDTSAFDGSGFDSNDTNRKSKNDDALTDENNELSSGKRPLADTQNNPLTTNAVTFIQTSVLPFKGIELFSAKRPGLAASHFEEDSLPVPTPFWKSFSVEGSVGISTFKNQPSKKTTDPEFKTILSNASANQLSFDLRFGLNYHFTDRVSFQTGVHYNQAKEDYTYKAWETSTYSYLDTVSFSVDSTTMDTTYLLEPVYYDSSSLNTNTVQNTYKLLTIPFQFAWNLPITPRGTLEFSAGGALSIFGRNTGTVIFSNNNDILPAQEAYHTTGMLSIGGSIKYLHKFGDHHAAYIEPWAQFGVTNQSSPQLNYESLRRRGGIRFGYRFYF